MSPIKRCVGLLAHASEMHLLVIYQPTFAWKAGTAVHMEAQHVIGEVQRPCVYHKTCQNRCPNAGRKNDVKDYLAESGVLSTE